MPVVQLIRGFRYGGEEVTTTESVADDLPVLLDVTVLPSVVGEEHLLPIDVSHTKAIVVMATWGTPATTPVGEFRINNNSNGSVISLSPSLPHLWSIASGLDNPLGDADVSRIFVDNDSTDQSMRLRVLGLHASEPA